MVEIILKNEYGKTKKVKVKTFSSFGIIDIRDYIKKGEEFMKETNSGLFSSKDFSVIHKEKCKDFASL